MGFFSKKPKEQTDPPLIIQNCLKEVSDRIMSSLEEEEYHWHKPWGVKKFESLILAKFFMDYSFKGLSEDKLKDDEKEGYYDLSKSSFSKAFNDSFSEVGMNYDDLSEKLDEKINKYFDLRRESRPPLCWHNIYSTATGSKTLEKIKDDLKDKKEGLEVIRGNEHFKQMVPEYEKRIKMLNDKIISFESAEMMLPHMVRFTKNKLKNINLKKIKALSKKLAKKDKGKKK